MRRSAWRSRIRRYNPPYQHAIPSPIFQVVRRKGSGARHI